MPYLIKAKRKARKQQVSMLQVIALTRLGIEVLIFCMGSLCSTELATASWVYYSIVQVVKAWEMEKHTGPTIHSC